MTDADKSLNLLHFGSNPENIGSGYCMEIWIPILDRFWLSQLKLKGQVHLTLVEVRVFTVLSGCVYNIYSSLFTENGRNLSEHFD